MSCTEVKNCNECEENDFACNCAIKDQSTDCSVYTGDNLSCSGIPKDTILTKVIQDLDAHICNKFQETTQYLTLVNVGEGAEIYKGISTIGNKEIRTLTSGNNNLLDVVQEANSIVITPGTPSMEIVDDTDTLRYSVTTSGGSTVYAEVDLSAYKTESSSNFTGASYNTTTNEITITVEGESDIILDLETLNNHVQSGSYASSNIKLILTNADEVDIDITNLVSEILTATSNAQVQSDYLETSSSSKAYIENKNPTKTITLGVSGSYNVSNTDNNYIIGIDNGTNDISINLTGITNTNNFFVGFVQKGTGEVTFSGYTIKPESLSDVLYGQGHICSVEIINSTKYLHGTLKAE